MTKALSACRTKGGHPPYTGTDGRPRPGTALREAYDSLRRGEIYYRNASRNVSYEILRTFYGMELERVYGRHGAAKGGCCGVRLVGEWEGDVFVPVERMTAGAA